MAGAARHDALCQPKPDVQGGWRRMVDIDLETFFDRVNQRVLMGKRIAGCIILRNHDAIIRCTVGLLAGKMERVK